MPTTTLAPAKSFRGISPRELLSAEATDGGPPVTVFGQTTRWYTLKAGLPLVLVGVLEAVTRHTERDTDPISDSVAGYNRIRFQCSVLASSVPSGTRLALRVLPYIGGAWSYFNVADEGPWLPLHAPATSDGVIIPVLSDWFVIDADFDTDNIVMEWVTYGGDGTGEVVIGNIHVQLSASTRPPTSEIPEPPVPTSGLLGDWPLYLGDIPGDVSGENNDLTLGANSPDDQDPGWLADPTRGLQFGPGASLKLKYAINSTLPYAAGELRALSLVFYLRFASLPAGEAWIFRLTSSGGGELQIRLKPSGALRLARGTDGTDPDIETSVLSVNTDYVIAVTCGSEIGDTLTVSVNAGTPVVSSAFDGQVAAFTSQPNLLWGADNTGFTAQIGLPGIIGHTRLWDGVISPAQIAATYADLRTEYPGLPLP